jgi:RHS repeat-associated protein
MLIEIDEETGLYYYGARYLDQKLSIWLSVDKPLIDGTYLRGEHDGGVYNSFNLAAYAYCRQNPIVFIDPDGNQVGVTDVYYSRPSGSGRSIERSHSFNNTSGKSSAIVQVMNSKGHTIQIFNGPNAVGLYHAQYGKPTKYTDNNVTTQKVLSNTWKGTKAVVKAALDPKGDALPVVTAPLVALETPNMLNMAWRAATMRAVISTGTQVAINQDVNLVQTASDAFLPTFTSSVIGSSMNLSVRALAENPSEAFQIYSGMEVATGIGTGLLPGALKSRYTGAINSLESNGAKTTSNILLDTSYQLSSQTANKALNEQ